MIKTMSENADISLVTFTTDQLTKQLENNAHSGHYSKITALQRAQQAQNRTTFYADDNILFCKTCSCTVDHSRQSNLEQHCKTKKHIRNCESTQPAKKQKTITTTLNIKNPASLEKVKMITDYIRVLASTNTPFHTINNPMVRKFFRNHVSGGGSLPTRQGLKPYLDDVYDVERQNLLIKVSKMKLLVIIDETSDDEGRYVVNVMFTVVGITSEHCKLKSYLASTYFEKKSVDHQKVSQLVIRTINDYKIDFRDVIGFCSDNVAYMIKAFREVLKPLLPNCVHLSCVAQIIHLVTKDYLKPFTHALNWIKLWPLYFSHSGVRKFRFLQFLKTKNLTPKTAPIPSLTRWGTYFEAISYHAEYFDEECKFIHSELDIFGDNVPSILSELKEIVNNKDIWQQTVMEITFLKPRASLFDNALNIFQSQLGQSIFIYPQIEVLIREVTNLRELNDLTILDHFDDEFFADLPIRTLQNFVSIVTRAAEEAQMKLLKYFGSSVGVHPSLQFLQNVPFFNPQCCFNFTEPNSIPGFDDVTPGEIFLYKEKAKMFQMPLDCPTNIETLTEKIYAIHQFWVSNRTTLPNLSKIALDYAFLHSASADVERSFKKLTCVFTEERRSFNEETLCKMLFLFINLNVDA